MKNELLKSLDTDLHSAALCEKMTCELFLERNNIISRFK